MAGHSKYKNIMHRKGRADAQRSKLFSKLSRDITVAAKLGVPDPAMNPRLRLAVNNAKAESLPRDVIQRAINKAAGGDVDTMEEVRYEGRGPGGVGIIVEALTDNRNRANSNIGTAFKKNGGALGEMNSVAFMWDRVGKIVYPAEAGTEDAVMEAAIEAGAQDVESDLVKPDIYEDAPGHTIWTTFEDLNEVAGDSVENPRRRQVHGPGLASPDRGPAHGRGGRHADETARRPRRRGRRPERLFERGHLRRGHGKVRGLTGTADRDAG